MITHYLKVAFRNLLKYKTQTVISILGLAVGFTCFTLSALWINYENTYDTFHPDAERLYIVSTDDEISPGKYGMYTPPALAGYLKEHWDEVEQATLFQDNILFVQKNNRMEEIPVLSVDTTFCQIMDIRVLEGSNQFMIPQKGNNDVAITQEGAQHLFGTTDKRMWNALFGKDVAEGKRFFKKVHQLLHSAGACHIPYPYSLFSRTDLADYVKINDLAKALCKKLPRNEYRQALVLWTEYLVRFKTFFDGYHAGTAGLKELENFRKWANEKCAGRRILRFYSFNQYTEQIGKMISEGKKWLHFGLDWEDAYVIKHTQTIFK